LFAMSTCKRGLRTLKPLRASALLAVLAWISNKLSPVATAPGRTKCGLNYAGASF
jgi:hypothetical protein